MSNQYFRLFNTKGTKMGALSLENIGYYENGVIEITEPKKQTGSNPFEKFDLTANEEFRVLTVNDIEILGDVKTHKDLFNAFDVNKASIDLRIPLDLVREMVRIGDFTVDSDGYYYYKSENMRNFVSIPHFINARNNICTIKKDIKKTLFFVDSTLTWHKDSDIFVKDTYVTKLIFEAYISVLRTGFFVAEGHKQGVQASLKEILNFFLYNFAIKGFYKSKIAYCQQIGNRGGESFELRADVLNFPAEVVNAKETDIETIVSKYSISKLVEMIADNPCIATTSMTQGFGCLLFSQPEQARAWEDQFIDGKYDVSATIGISAKVDKHLVKRNMCFLTIANEKDNNCFGSALSGKDSCGKYYALHPTAIKGIKDCNTFLRIKYPVSKAHSHIVVRDKLGNIVPNWIIAPVSECDPAGEDPFAIEDKFGNIQQLLHLGYIPEQISIEVEGVVYESYMFRDIRFYIDPMTSSDKNIDTEFELKPYSTMFSSIMNDILLGHKGEEQLEEFEARLKSIIDVNKINKLCNLAGLTTTRGSIKHFR